MCQFVARYCASGFIVTGKRVFDYYNEQNVLERRPCMAIQAPVNTSLFDPNTVNSDSRISSVEGVKILTVANINRLKGHEHFVEMASALSGLYNDLHFFVVGAVFNSKEDYFQELKKMLGKKGLKNFTYLGPSDNVPSFLKAADICVFTSLRESGPMSVWEAMSMGKPIVTTDVGSVRDFIRDDENGFIVPVGDVKALTEKVGILIKDAYRRKEFGAKARDEAVSALDINICVKKHNSFYREILRKHQCNELSR